MAEKLQGKIVKEYLTKFPNVPTLTIAKKIYKENTELFTNIDSARALIRYYRGLTGDKARGRLKDKEFIKPITNNTNPFKLPESFAHVRKDFVLPPSANNILMLSDIHLPYHDVQALTLALKYGVDKNVNTVFLNGDIIDMYQASFHEKDPRNRSLKDEMDCARWFIEVLKNTFPRAKIYFKEGNHCARLRRYLMVKAPELLDCTEFELPELLKFKENDIQWIPNKQAVKIGKLYSLHGNEFKGGGGVNPARAYYTKSKVSMIAGDKHRTSEHTETSLDGTVVTCWSTGCLCELSPDYMPYNAWNLGFAHITVEPDGNFEVYNKRIIKGKIV